MARCELGRHVFVDGKCIFNECPVKEGEEPGLEKVKARTRIVGNKIKQVVWPGEEGYDEAKPLDS